MEPRNVIEQMIHSASCRKESVDETSVHDVTRLFTIGSERHAQASFFSISIYRLFVVYHYVIYQYPFSV